MCMMVSQCNTCAMVVYLTIQYQGECGHIEGHAYSVLFVHNEICVLGFHVYMSLIIASCTPEIIHFITKLVGVAFVYSQR